MFDNIASIDAGNSSVKLIKAKRGIRNFEIISVTMEEYDLELFETDSNAAVNIAIQRLIENEDLSEYTIISTIPSDRVIFRNITFPFSDISKIAEAINYEAEESIPYPLEDVVIDFQLLPHESGSGRSVILAALTKKFIEEKIRNFSESGIPLMYAGVEANSHLRCYEYFNSVSSENIIVIDLGHKKTVANIIKDSRLIFTRSVDTGICDIINFVSGTLNVNLNEARRLLRELDLDLSSFDSNIKNENFKQLNISKPKLKKIHDHACEVISKIVDEISLTIKAGSSFNDFIEFSRIIITGGGSNIRGISKIISEETGIPVVFMPFLSGYLDIDIRSRFSVSLGNLLVFMNHKSDSINFLNGEYSSDASNNASSKYIIPVFFVTLAAAVFIINIMITFIQVSRSNSYTDELLKQKFRRYFGVASQTDDPVKEAGLLVQKEQKELNVLRDLLGDEAPFMPMLNLITESLQAADGFMMRKMTFDGQSVVIEGETSKSSDLESFKKNLLDSGEFESVSINIKDTSKSRSLFTMTIKRKL